MWIYWQQQSSDVTLAWRVFNLVLTRGNYRKKSDVISNDVTSQRAFLSTTFICKKHKPCTSLSNNKNTRPSCNLKIAGLSVVRDIRPFDFQSLSLLRVIKARFPLPELTARVNGPSWRVTGFHYPWTWAVLTGNGNRSPVNSRQLG